MDDIAGQVWQTGDMMREDPAVASLRPWAGRLRRADQRANTLLSLDDPNVAQRVPALPPLDVALGVKALGVHDSVSVLGLMSPAQVRTLFDLEMWDGDRLASEDVVSWLVGFQEAGLEVLQAAAASMDREALVLLLRRRLRIGLRPKDDASEPTPVPDWMANPPPELEPLVETPDGVYIIAARVVEEGAEDVVEGAPEPLDEEARKWILGFVDALYRQQDWPEAGALLRAAMDELSSSLEEDALRFSSGRLEDLGFPPLARALEVYAPLDPKILQAPPAAPSPELDRPLPAPYIHALSAGLLRELLEAVDDPAFARRLEAELLPVANKVLVADRVKPGQRAYLESSLAGMRGYIELALAHGVPPEQRVEVGLQRLRARHPSELLRLGYTLTLRAKARAKPLLELPLDVLDESALEALCGRRPRLSLTLEPWVQAGGSAALASEGLGQARAFTSPEDLAAVHAWLDELEALAAFVREGALVATPTDALPAAPERSLDLLAATALCRRMLGQPATATALSDQELAELADGVEQRGGQARLPEARRVRALEGLDPKLAPRAERWLTDLATQLYPLVGADRLDPRFVEGVLRRLSG